MRVKTFFLFIALLFVCNISCKADGGGGFPIDIVPQTDNGNHGPRRAPANASISGVFNIITQTLLLNVSEEADVREVTIIKDGVLIISENVSSEVPGMIMFDLSAYGTGTYQVEVRTESGITYIGYFSYNQQ